MTRHMTYHNLVDAMGKPGCFVCRLVGKAVNDYLGTLLYESINDVGTRDSLRESNGFCAEHAWLLCSLGDPLGHSIIYGDLVGDALESLKRLLVSCSGTTGRTIDAQVKRLLPGHKCPACLVARGAQERYVATLVEELAADPMFEMEFAASSGLCLSHLVDALEASQNAEATRRLLRITIGKLERLRAQLAEVKRKHDYRFSKEPWGDEKDAWIRAVEVWGGLRQAEGLCGP